MKAQFVSENVKFERGLDPKDSMSVGHKHSPEVFKANAIVDTNGKPLEDQYDINKFLSNMESGFHPSNLFVANLSDPTGVFYRQGDEAWGAEELKKDGYKEVLFQGKYFTIG